MNIRQANGIGRVHVAKPRLRETYCGRPIDDETGSPPPRRPTAPVAHGRGTGQDKLRALRADYGRGRGSNADFRRSPD